MFRSHKIISVFLALLLTVAMMPATVFAADDTGSGSATLILSVSNATDNTAELTFKVTGYAGECIIKYLVLEKTEDSPDVDTIKNTGKTVEKGTATVTDLTPETAYKVYSIAFVSDADGDQILAGISVEEFTTLSGSTPVMPVINHASVELAEGGAELTFTADKACTYYYLVYEQEIAAPDANDIKAQGEAIAKGSGSANADEAITVFVTADFDLDKAYTLYLVVEDENGTFSEISILPLNSPIKMLDASASDPVTIEIETVAANGTGYTYSGGVVTIADNGNYIITGSGTATTNCIKFANGVEANITLNNVNIDVSTCAFDITGATVDLKLMGDNILKSGVYSAGLQVPIGATLNISADSTGKLTAIGANNSAGIGNRSNRQCGIINIEGGEIYAQGGQSAPGIGGEDANITIAGGTINAYGGESGTGIGSRLGAVRVLISGGTVNATGGSGGAGIGGTEVYGEQTKISEICIKGGNVTAIGGQYSAGIGASYYYGCSGRIIIEGGTITAQGKDGGAGIGGAKDSSVTQPIIISGGNITATGGNSGAGIGGGGGSLTTGNCKDVIITGGHITATGGTYSAGIGGGQSTSDTGFSVLISGPNTIVNVKCDIKMNAYDIGTGHFTRSTSGADGTLTLEDGATLNYLGRGTNLTANYRMGVIGGAGAGSSAGVYYNNKKCKGVIDVSAPETGWYKGNGYTVSGNVVNIDEAGNYYIFGSSTTNRIKIKNSITADITLDSVSIDVSEIPYACAFDITGATVNLTLTGESKLASGENCAGLQVPNGAALTVLQTSTGGLSAYGGANGAGIGGGASNPAGSITVLGGMIDAYGGKDGAGIGGGSNASGGIVKIDGGEDIVVSCMSAEESEGYDIGSGKGNSIGGSLEVNNGARVYMDSNGTNANVKYITCTIHGEGAKLDAGKYINSQKQLRIRHFVIDPEDRAKAFDNIKLSVEVVGLSEKNPEGTIVFKANDEIIGESFITRDDGQSSGTAVFEWTNVSGGTKTITAEYKQNEESDSYFTPDAATITSYEISKISQDELAIQIPETITYGDEPFDLDISGGGGSGSIRYEVTSGNAVSVDSSGLVTVERAGMATITVTKSEDAHYLETAKSVDIVVNKATPPEVKFPTASAITYGQTLADSVLSGGSDNGTFAWEDSSIKPDAGERSYKVIFTPNDTVNYDYTGIELEKNINITVNKAVPAVTFPTASEITYGQTLAASDLTGGSGDGCFAWLSPGTVPTVINSGYTVVFTPNETDNYLPVEQIVAVTVQKANQTPLSVSGIPESITYGDPSFTIAVFGGSGSGSLSYEVTSGDVVTVDSNGKISIIKAGTAQITVTKSGDSNYLNESTTIDITVKKATPPEVQFPTASAITYGQRLEDSELTGGSGDGEFAWEDSSTKPPVKNEGYKVIFTPRDTDNYDYTGIELEKIISITVNKAVPAVTFPSASPITYGQSLADSVLTGGIGNGEFAWKYPLTIPPVINEGYGVVFTPNDTNNYLSVEQKVAVTVNKANQMNLTVSGIPETIAYGDPSFTIAVSGGSGTGAVSFAVDGEAVTVDDAGQVTIVKIGTATITVTKAGDDNYLDTSTTISITVYKTKQAPLTVSGIPKSLRVGQTPFTIVVGGGSGTGAISFEVTKGNAVTIDASGKVTIVKEGTASITITKAEDENYQMEQMVIELTVKGASSGSGGSSGGSTSNDSTDSRTYVQDENIIDRSNKVSVDLTSGSTLLSSSQTNKLIALNETKPVTFVGNGYSITFPVGRMKTMSYTSFNFGAYINSGSYYDRVKAISSNSFVLMIDFHQSGSLPGKAQVKIKVGTSYAGKTLYYHYYNPLTGNLEYRQTVTVDRDGYVTVEQSHFSAYALTTTILGDRPNIPETGGGDSYVEDVAISIGAYPEIVCKLVRLFLLQRLALM